MFDAGVLPGAGVPPMAPAAAGVPQIVPEQAPPGAGVPPLLPEQAPPGAGVPPMVKFCFSKKVTKFEKIYVELLTSASYSVFSVHVLNFCQ